MSYRANIIAEFIKADSAQIEAGIEWYARAHRLALELDPTNVSRAAGVIAAMSPLMSWPQNVKVARNMYAGLPVKGLSRNVAKAYAIFSGAEPLDILGGDKVRSFYMTILDPTISDSVVIDRHAAAIAVGHILSDAERGRVITKKGYKVISEAYKDAAAIISGEWRRVSPAELQAIVWTSWREREAMALHEGAAW